MNRLGMDDVLVRSTGLEAADLDGETALLSVAKGSYFGLNDVGSRIWALLERPISPRGLCLRLLEEYDVSPETCEAEVTAYLQALLELDLVARASEEA